MKINGLLLILTTLLLLSSLNQMNQPDTKTIEVDNVNFYVNPDKGLDDPSCSTKLISMVTVETENQLMITPPSPGNSVGSSPRVLLSTEQNKETGIESPLSESKQIVKNSEKVSKKDDTKVAYETLEFASNRILINDDSKEEALVAKTVVDSGVVSELKTDSNTVQLVLLDKNENIQAKRRPQTRALSSRVMFKNPNQEIK